MAGLLQAAGVAGAPSSWQRYPVTLGSVLENENAAEVCAVRPLGAASMVTAPGAVRSTFHVKVAGVASAFPAASTAWTANVWAPSPTGESTDGLVQAVQLPPSTWHRKLPASVAENEKLGVAWLLRSAGLPVMAVSGAAVSTVQVRVAGVGSVLPTASVAATAKVCDPSARPE